jgi:hypothetical protein
MDTYEQASSSCDSSIPTESEEPTSTRMSAKVVVKITTAEVTQHNESLRPKELTAAITAIGPTLLKRYISHQAGVCNQTETDLNRSLELYLISLDSPQTEQESSFSVGDLWSGLIWWRDEASWVGRVGVFSLSDVKLMAQEIIKSYLLNVKQGNNQEGLPDSLAKSLSGRLFLELTADNEAPGLRTIISRCASLD